MLIPHNHTTICCFFLEPQGQTLPKHSMGQPGAKKVAKCVIV